MSFLQPRIAQTTPGTLPRTWLYHDLLPRLRRQCQRPPLEKTIAQGRKSCGYAVARAKRKMLGPATKPDPINESTPIPSQASIGVKGPPKTIPPWTPLQPPEPEKRRLEQRTGRIHVRNIAHIKVIR